MPMAMELFPRSLVMKMFINKKGIMKRKIFLYTHSIYRIYGLNMYKL